VLRILKIVFGALALIAVMVIGAGLTLRIALHAREVSIPDFSAMTVAQASEAALHNGLDLNIEDKFYSTTVPAGRILSQAPAAGSRVRRGWQVRVTESLGPQEVSIPDVVGEPVRGASLDLRRMSLDLGTLAHMEAPGEPDMVLAQTPPPNAGVDQPRVNLLLSSEAGGPSAAFLMPSFVGLSYASANRAAIAMGFKVAAIDLSPPPAAPVTSTTPTAPGTSPMPGTAPATAPPTEPAAQAPPAAAGEAAAPAAPAVPAGPVNAQSPEAGFRANRGQVVRFYFGHAPSNQPSHAAPASSSPATQ
jgi:beta-lactam-binding protein with PASTA domain